MDSPHPYLPLNRESPAVYRPRNLETTLTYRLVSERFEEFALIHEARFEARDGPLRSVVRRVVDEYLDCGILENGFARVRCPECGAEYFCAFSCQTRNFCGSCQQKRAELLAGKLRAEVLAPVEHRHLIFTIPRPLRGLFLRERRLLGILPRSAFEAVKRCFRVVLSRKPGVPGMVAALQTFGGQVQWNPHVHSLVSDGIFLEGGQFIPLPRWSEEFEELLTETFRRLVLDELVKAERLSSDFRENLLSFRHGGGFSVYGRHLILNTEPARLAHMARYMVRPPVSADRVHEADDGRVLLEIPADPRTGDTVLVLDPLEWLRRLTNQIPAPRSHLVRYYGAYANRCRSRYRDGDGQVTARPASTEDRDPLPKSRASWARLLRMVFEVDPLTCRRCGAKMKVIAVITAPALIDKLLRHVRKRTAGKSNGGSANDTYDPRAPPAA